MRVRPPRLHTKDDDEQQQRRWRAWAVPFLSLVVIMGLLTAAQSHLTAYEEKRNRDFRLQEDQSYAVLRDSLPSHGKNRSSTLAGDGHAHDGKATEPPGHEDRPVAEPAADILRDLVSLSRPSPSRDGKKYRSLICALSRNDVHLREYIVRNLLAGFQHIVLYDNNQVGGNRGTAAVLVMHAYGEEAWLLCRGSWLTGAAVMVLAGGQGHRP